MNNSEITTRLLQIADLLGQQQANPFRVIAYRRAAASIAGLQKPVTDIVEQKGFEGLVELPAVGEGIARSIFEYIGTGRMSRLESLQAGHDPVEMFERIPGIGTTLAHRIIENLHIDTLEALEIAAHNGRLNKVPGFSDSKVEMVQAWLQKILGYRQLTGQHQAVVAEPAVDLLLQIDRQYRTRAVAGKLLKMAPKRFNPSGKKWLPILHSTLKEWHFTALYSNTARAHQFGRTRDWVVIYFYDQNHHEGQHTVVTETKGALIGKRVVRGREDECLEHYFDDGT